MTKKELKAKDIISINDIKKTFKQDKIYLKLQRVFFYNIKMDNFSWLPSFSLREGKEYLKKLIECKWYRSDKYGPFKISDIYFDNMFICSNEISFYRYNRKFSYNDKKRYLIESDEAFNVRVYKQMQIILKSENITLPEI